MARSGFAALALAIGCTREPMPPRGTEQLEAEVRVEPRTPEKPPELGEPARPVEAAKQNAQARRVREPPLGFVELSEAVPGVVLDVRYATVNNFTQAPLPGYVPGVLWVHESTAAALARVQASLAETGLRLRVYDAYRPDRTSAAMFTWAHASGQEALLRDGYVARHSNHARGNTVDLTLETIEGEPLDMGTAWDTFSPHSHYAAARGKAMAHRRALRRAMMRAGFQPYAKEWWHFTLRQPAGLPRLDVPYDGSASGP